MAFLTCRFFSRALNSNASIHVIVPTPQSNEAEENGAVYASSGTFPVVYLLHGLHGDCNSWMRLSRIEHYVQTRRCAAVMASGGNAFYQDMYRGPAYATFFTRELPALVCRALDGELTPLAPQKRALLPQHYSWAALREKWLALYEREA